MGLRVRAYGNSGKLRKVWAFLTWTLLRNTKYVSANPSPCLISSSSVWRDPGSLSNALVFKSGYVIRIPKDARVSKQFFTVMFMSSSMVRCINHLAANVCYTM